MTTWFNLLAVGFCGALGSVARYLITVAAAAVPGGSTMFGTTIVNVLGCAAIGAFSHYTFYADNGGVVSERLRLAIQVGFLGSLTTYSAFAAESAGLAVGDRIPAAGLYVAANLLLGWLALTLGAISVRGWVG